MYYIIQPFKVHKSIGLLICINSDHHNQLKIFLSLKKETHTQSVFINNFLFPPNALTPNSGRSNQSILKEINPKYSLEGQMLKQKL